MALALAGLCGIVARSAMARRREIGIRIALGARRHTIAAMMLARAARIAAAAVCAGTLGAMGVAHWIAARIPGMTATGGVLAAAVAVFVLSLGAALVPSWRAAGADSVRSIRQD